MYSFTSLVAGTSLTRSALRMTSVSPLSCRDDRRDGSYKKTNC